MLMVASALCHNLLIISQVSEFVTREFISFLKEYGIIGLAIAVIIGGKLNLFVTSLVSDLVMPVLFQPMLNAANVNNIRELEIEGIFYGRVVAAAMDFLIVAFVVFLFAKFILKEEQVKKK